MKILFVLGGLEPGANGVGDYSRLLAEEVVRQTGHQCALLALNDPFVSAPIISTLNDGSLQLRLPATSPWKQRIERASNFVNEFAPDWVSLQFVPYSFHPKGIVSRLGVVLRPLMAKRRVHVMFHELWIGENHGAGYKEVGIGLMQRHYSLRTIRQLQPNVVSTSNGVYLAILSEHDIEAGVLPLFGNIPICIPLPDEARAFEVWWRHFERSQEENNNKQEWTGIFFGSLHPQWKPEPLLSSLREEARKNNRKLHLVAVGRLGRIGEAMWQTMNKCYGAEVVFSHLGEQASRQVSLAFQKADFGVATSPWQLIEKSGSAAAMLDHGLPVIVNRDDWHWRGKAPVVPPNNPLLHNFDDTSPSLLMNLQKRAPEESLPIVTTEFLRQLQVENLYH